MIVANHIVDLFLDANNSFLGLLVKNVGQQQGDTLVLETVDGRQQEFVIRTTQVFASSKEVAQVAVVNPLTQIDDEVVVLTLSL